MSGMSELPISVDFSTVDGTALAGVDYMAAGGTLNFAPGIMQQTISVALVDDVLYEDVEDFAVVLANPVNANLDSGNVAFGWIYSYDSPPVLSVGNATVVEGDSGSTEMVFTVALSAPSSLPASVVFETLDGLGSALPGDYVPRTELLTFAPGETTRQVSVTVNGDVVTETDESLVVALSSPSNAWLGSSFATGTIVNDDPLNLLIDPNTFTVNEGDFFSFVPTIANSDVPVQQLQFFLDSGAAGQVPAGAGIEILGGQFAWLPSSSQGGATYTFDVVVLAPALGLSDRETVSITVNDVEEFPTFLSLGNASVLEGNAGTTLAGFTVTLSQTSPNPISVEYTTSDWTAQAGSDYVGTTGVLSINPFETGATIFVEVIGDTDVEALESFTLTLFNPVNAVVHPVAWNATGSIVNDDGLPAISIGDVSVFEGDAGDTTLATFSVVRVGEFLDQPSSVLISTLNGTAAGGDFQPFGGVVIFAPGEKVQTFSVVVNGDGTPENDEVFFVNLFSPDNATLADAQGTGSIFDDDALSMGIIGVNDVSVFEGDDGTTLLNFTVSRAHGQLLGVVSYVDYHTTDATAVAGSPGAGDYSGVSGTIIFGPSESTKIVTVQVHGDLEPEGHEFFQLRLSNPVFAVLGRDVGTGEIRNDDIGGALMLASETVAEVPEGESVTAAQLDAMLVSAIVLWTKELGADEARLALLETVTIGVANFAGAELGSTGSGSILIDADAAGHGWFVDVSAADSSEFSVRLDRNALAATPSSDAFGRMDLLTVVMHEIGHVLGFDHLDAAQYSVMREDLDAGVRYTVREPMFDFGTAGAGGSAGVVDWNDTAPGWNAGYSPYAAPVGRNAEGNYAEYLVRL